MSMPGDKNDFLSVYINGKILLSLICVITFAFLGHSSDWDQGRYSYIIYKLYKITNLFIDMLSTKINLFWGSKPINVIHGQVQIKPTSTGVGLVRIP